jgi:hypothetical protein
MHPLNQPGLFLPRGPSPGSFSGRQAIPTGPYRPPRPQGAAGRSRAISS